MYNFSPGPAMLPESVMRQAQRNFRHYQSLPVSIVEVSHRGADFMSLYQHTESLLRLHLDIPDDYDVLFLAGGATGQTAAIPQNLASREDLAAYAISGHWSKRAKNEAEKFVNVHIAADSHTNDYRITPKQFDIPESCRYLHYVDNETVHGVAFKKPPPCSIPLVVDMSSSILSRPIKVSDYGLIYASAQKNIGIAGVTVVIVRRDLVMPQAITPSIFNYQYQAQAQSMWNTPPVFAIYMLSLVLEWAQEKGGVEKIYMENQEKANLLYQFLDSSHFYSTQVDDLESRSIMNIPFFLPTKTAQFLKEANLKGLMGLAGHKVLGGCRASLYNAMSVEGVSALIDYMSCFERQNES